MQEVFCSHAKIRVSVRVVANRIRSWAELAPRLKAAAKRGDQKVLAARYDLTSDQISRYLSAVMSPPSSLSAPRTRTRSPRRCRRTK